MALQIEQATLDQISQTNKAIILGKIDDEERVHLKVSDPKRFPGHVEWLHVEPMNAIRGFSLLVHRGKVTSFFPRSRINATRNAIMEAEIISDLLELLPVDDSVEVLD